MSAQDFAIPSLVIPVAGGIDESTQDADPGAGLVASNGLAPYFYALKALYQQQDPKGQGAIQRITGKKLIDANPNQKILGICQVFNGFGQYGYLVETNKKLYFHTCESPIPQTFSLVVPGNLGVDESGHTLDIFAQGREQQPPPDLNVSCMFEYPVIDKPTPNNAGHAGCDFAIISVIPINGLDVDIGHKARLACLNSGTSYDNKDVGSYDIQNACRADSVPLVFGDDGSYRYPPSNTKTAFLAWSGAVELIQWQQTTPTTWVITPPPVTTTTTTPIWRGFIKKLVNISDISTHFVTYADTPNQVFYNVATRQYVKFNPSAGSDQFGTYGQYQVYVGSPTPPVINVANDGVLQNPPPAVGTWGRQGVDIYRVQLVNNVPTWVLPYDESTTVSYTPHWTWANQAARLAQVTSSADVGQKGLQQDTNTYYQLTNSTTVTWHYPNSATRLAVESFVATDIGKIAQDDDTLQVWILTAINRHQDQSNRLETYLINLNRLFADFQTIAPATIQFMLRAFWNIAKNGDGSIYIQVDTFKGGYVNRGDGGIWFMSSDSQHVASASSTIACNRVANGDAKGDNLVQITLTMANGSINLNIPTPNVDGGLLCGA